MSDPNKGRYQRLYKREFEVATARLAELGGTLEWGAHDYEAFTFKAKGVGLIFYPHRTSAGNTHIRVRCTGKNDREALRHALSLLVENSCTFQYPADRVLEREAAERSRKRGDFFTKGFTA